MKNTFYLLQLLSLVYFSTVALPGYAQPGDLKWKYALTGSSADVTQLLTDSAGNAYIIGIFSRDKLAYQTRSAEGMTGLEEKNTFVLKVMPTGKPVYLYSIRSMISGGNITPGKACINQKGELALAFYTEATDNFKMGNYSGSISNNQKNAFVAKLSKTGIIAWVHALEVVKDTFPEAMINDIFLEESGSVFLTGYFRGTTMVINDSPQIDGIYDDAMLFLGRIDPRGNVPWLVNCAYDISGSGSIRGTHLCNTTEDFVYLAGYHQNYRPFYFGSDTILNAYGTDAFLSLYTKDGNAMWARTFRGDSSEFVEKLAVTPDNDAILLGMSNSTLLSFDGNTYSTVNGNYDLFLARYNATGSCVNSMNITTQMNYRDNTGDNAYMSINKDGNILLCGVFNGTNVFFNGGSPLNNTDGGTSDLLYARIDGNTMTPVWRGQGGGTGNIFYDDVFFDNNGNTFIAGTSYNFLDIDGQLIEGDNKDGSPYLAKILPSGNLDYSYWQLNTTDHHINIREVASDNFGNTFVTGSFFGPDPVLDDLPLVEPDQQGFFLAKYSRVKYIGGIVLDAQGSPFNQGYVKLYGHTLYQRSPVVDSVEIAANGEFIFKDIPFGEYILVAIPETSDDHEVITTYYPQAEYWEFAEHIKVDEYSGPHYHTIELLPAPEFTGGAMLEGGVTALDSTDLFKTSAKGRPKQKASVVLVGSKSPKSTYEVVAIAETDEYGNFTFKSVEDGYYLLYVDFPGLPVEDFYEIEIIGNQYVSSLDYVMDEEKIYTGSTPVYNNLVGNTENPDLLIYPNPATDFIDIIHNTDQKMIIDLFNSNGKHIDHMVSENPAKLILNDQPAGTYFVRIRTSDKFYFEKISIK